MSLESRAIAAMRQKLCKMNVIKLHQEWKNSYKLPPGMFSENGVIYQHDLRRDILAFSILHYVHYLAGYCYGGFVRELYSGLAWKDLDVRLNSGVVDIFVSRLPMLLSDNLGLDVFSFSTELSQKREGLGYAKVKTFELRWICEEEEIIIPIDVVDQVAFSIPVTIGSCLCLYGQSIRFSSACSNGMINGRAWDIIDILKLLSYGKDVCCPLNQFAFCGKSDPHRSDQKFKMYIDYYNKKTDWLEKRYILSRHLYGPEPIYIRIS